MSIPLNKEQIEAVKKMKNGCILCGRVGSGKSRTSLAYYYIRNGGNIETACWMTNPKDLYIITTAKKRDTFEWETEFPYFLINTDPLLNPYHNKVVIDSWNNIMKYVDVKDAFFIFDEQRVVGKGVWVKSFLKIAKSNEWILLSATPGDTWEDYIPVFIANGFYKNRTEFSMEHIIWKAFRNYHQIEGYRNTGRLVRLRRNILVDIDTEVITVPHHENVDVSYDISAYRDVLRSRMNPFTD